MKYAIEVKGLTKHYQGFTLDHVNFQVPAGSIVGFIGENGAGKSTTIKAILDLIHIDEGKVRILEEDAGMNNKAVKEQIGVVFDESYFPDGMKVPEIHKMMKHIFSGWEEEKFFRYAKEFKLPLDKKVKEFSRGMKMKLSIAVALSHHTKLLILDEATSGLDPVVRNEILDIFLDFIQEEDHTIFLSSHITSDIEKISDYILLIHEGRILLFENKDTLLYDYGLVRCSHKQLEELNPEHIIGVQKNQFEAEALISNRKELEAKSHDYIIDRVSIEDILLYVVNNIR